MKLTAVRHTSVNVPSGVCYGFSDVSLNSSFQEEADKVKEKIKGLHFDQVYSSPLSRCLLLANYCGFENPTPDSRIKELNFGDWEMKSWMEIDKTEAQGWFEDWLNYPAKNGESYSLMKQRVDDFLNELKQKNNKKNICLFTHGGVIRLIHVYTGAYAMEESFDFPVEYGDVFHFEIR
ncbi:MAG: alpha-ribazole phosphatase [Dysgonamonadaceae bacterium]|jgi:alpha-ribazole phosphatase|nr:alpha-ribazole phosphatase [Dysgonamonadaceae bacterium]